MDSPYTPGAGVSPPVLAGRDSVRGRAVELLARTASYGAPGQSPLIMTGVRGVGKTVLLQAIADQAAGQGFLTARVTLDRHGPAAVRIAAAVAAAMQPLHPDHTGRWRRWIGWLRQLTVEVSVPGVKISHPLGTAPAPGPGTAGDRDAVVALLKESAQLARQAGPARPGLCLAIDEVQEASEADLGIVTAIAQDLVDQPLVVLGAGLPNTPDRLMAAGSFAERFTYLRLEPLTEPDATAALLIPATQRQVYFNQDAAHHLLHAAAGSPFLIQLYGDHAWRAANPQPGSRITLPHVQAGIITATTGLWDGLFRGRWNRASALEQQYLAALAQRLEPDGTADSRQIAAAMGRTTAQLSTIRARLLDKGLIHGTRRGRVGFTLPGFEQFVRQESAGDTP